MVEKGRAILFLFSFKLQGRLCTVFASLICYISFCLTIFVSVVVVNVESCMRKHGKSGNGIFCLFLLLLGWAIACVLRWDTCCDCSCFVCQRYLKLTGLLLGERFLRWRGTSLSRTSPRALQLNIVSASSHAAAGFRIKTKCVVEPNHAPPPVGRGWLVSSSRAHCRKRKAVADLRRMVRGTLLLGGPRESAHCIDT